MSDWLPPPDIRFDHAAAAHLVTAAETTRARVDEALGRVERDHRVAVNLWAGRAGRVVDDRLERWRRALETLRDDLTTLAGQVADASAWAADEQARRRALQAQWAAERAAEAHAAAAELDGADSMEATG